MLEDLYERKHCNSLLVPKADEDVRWVQEKQPNRRRRTTTVDSGVISCRRLLLKSCCRVISCFLLARYCFHQCLLGSLSARN